MTEKTRNIWWRLQNIPRYAYYTIILLLVSIVLVNPIGLPIPVSGQTKELYDLIEGLPDGSVVLMDIAFDSGAMGELGPAFTAVMHHLFQKNLKIIVMTLYIEGPQMYNILVENKINPDVSYKKSYGTDYIFLGYNAGGVTTMAEMAKNMKFLRTDYKGTPLGELPIMQNVNDYHDIDLVITVTTSSGGISSPADWVQQWSTPYGVKLACVVLKMMVPTVSPYYGAGQVQALIPGAGASGEYEKLVNRPGEGLKSTDALSMAQLVVVLLILLGNIGYFGSKYSEKMGQKGGS